MDFQHNAISIRVVRALCEGSLPRPFFIFLGAGNVRVLNDKDILVTEEVVVPILIQGRQNIQDAKRIIKPGMKLLINYTLVATKHVAENTSIAPGALILLAQSLVPVPTSGGLSDARM